MPFTWQININKVPTGPPRVTFDPNPLNNVEIGDQIIWTNNDGAPHWPALKASNGTINNQYFMANQIAPNSPSDTFVVSETPTTLNYVCFLHQDETGAIVVVSSS
jgi:plastocyanin